MSATANLSRPLAPPIKRGPGVADPLQPQMNGTGVGAENAPVLAPVAKKPARSEGLPARSLEEGAQHNLDHRLQTKQTARVALQHAREKLGRTRAEVVAIMSRLLGYAYSETRLEKAVKESALDNNLSIAQGAAFSVATGTTTIFTHAVRSLGLAVVDQRVAEVGKLAVQARECEHRAGELVREIREGAA